MPKQGDCPGTAVYDWGYGPRAEGQGGTEAVALMRMRALLPAAKNATKQLQEAALNRALAIGNAACKPGQAPCEECEAWFRDPDLGAPWTAVGALDPFNNWLARGGYKWTIEVDCRCLPDEGPECAFEVAAAGTEIEGAIDALRLFRDERLPKSSAGRRYLKLFEKHNGEMIAVLFKQPDLLALAQGLLPKLMKYVPKTKSAKGKRVEPKLIKEIDQALEQISAKVSAELREEVDKLRSDLHCFSGVPIVDGLKRVR